MGLNLCQVICFIVFKVSELTLHNCYLPWLAFFIDAILMLGVVHLCFDLMHPQILRGDILFLRIQEGILYL